MNNIVTALWVSLAATLGLCAVVAIVILPVFLGAGPLLFGVYSFILVWVAFFAAVVAETGEQNEAN